MGIVRLQSPNAEKTSLMTHTPHELSDMFPDDVELIHELKLKNAHFAKISERHHDVNRAIHRIETDVEPVSDAHAEDLKKQRLALQDEIAGMIAVAKAPV